MTQQEMFGGEWTQQKLRILSEYLKAYRKIFARNERARYFRISYVDAFAGTGLIPRPDLEGTLAGLIPSLVEAEEEFKKGSVRRALEVNPPFHKYLFIEKDGGKCEELLALRQKFVGTNIEVEEGDANVSLLKWCRAMDPRSERAVVFIDPFGASVDWNVIEAIAATNAVDLWILFPYSAINRMLTRDRRPSSSWSDKLTRVFGTDLWESEFYASDSVRSILDPDSDIERVWKTADQATIVNFYANRLRTCFSEVAEPGLLHNSKGLLFVFFFATRNEAGCRIANHLLRNIAR
jgi:three-Cys-motif partner protein